MAWPVSIGIGGQTGSRSAPSVLNTAYGKTMFWDGRAPSLEGQAQGPVQNPIEMGKQSYKEIVDRLRKVPGYVEQFQKVFGTNVTWTAWPRPSRPSNAWPRFRGIPSTTSTTRAITRRMSDSEKRGMVLFGLTLNTDDEFKSDAVRQKAKCTLCHAGFNFTDEQFHNLGVGWNEKTGKFADLGRWAIDPIGAKSDASLGAFKTPTVRDVEHNAPYMHDGSLATLEEVVDHYDKGGNPNPALDPDMKKLGLTAQEKKDVVAFMKALSGETKKLDELLPKLPPDSGGKAPDPRAALTPPSKAVAAVLFHPAADALSRRDRRWIDRPGRAAKQEIHDDPAVAGSPASAGSLFARTGRSVGCQLRASIALERFTLPRSRARGVNMMRLACRDHSRSGPRPIHSIFLGSRLSARRHVGHS